MNILKKIKDGKRKEKKWKVKIIKKKKESHGFSISMMILTYSFTISF